MLFARWIGSGDNMGEGKKWTCPKCTCCECIHVPGRKGGRGGVPMGFFQVYNMQPSRYICGRCGFVEECFDVPEHLEAVRLKYGESPP